MVDKKYRESIMKNSIMKTCIDAERKKQHAQYVKAFELIKTGTSNLAIATKLGITYEEALAYRLSYERRCKK